MSVVVPTQIAFEQPRWPEYMDTASDMAGRGSLNSKLPDALAFTIPAAFLLQCPAAHYTSCRSCFVEVSIAAGPSNFVF